MSKVWFVAVVLGLFGSVALAKDKANDKKPEHKPAEPKPAARPQPTTPAPAPTPAPAIKPVPPTPTPAAPSKKMEDSHKSAEPRHNPGAKSAAPHDPSKSVPKSAGNSTPSIPAGKTGTALGPLPAPNKNDPGQPLQPATEKKSEHQNSANKSANHGSKNATPLPTPPKFKTDGQIPAIGTPLVGSATTPERRGEAKSNAGPRPSNNSPTPHKRDDDDQYRHTPSHVYNDHHYHRSHGSGFSWLIIGAATPYGPGGYGPGYGIGRAYGGVPGGYYYVPPQNYGPTVIAAAPPVPVVIGAPLPSPRPLQMTADEFAAFPIARQRELLLQALNAFEEDLVRSPNGEEWSRHLQLATAARLIGEGDAPLEATTRARLRSIVELFYEVAADPAYRAISDLGSFHALQGGLGEFASEPLARSRRQLAQAAAGLSKTLDTWSSAERWRTYLQLAWLIGTDEEEQLDLDARLAQFEKVLAKFDRVKSDDQFQVVTEPPAFDATHTALRTFVRDLQSFLRAPQPGNDGQQ